MKKILIGDCNLKVNKDVFEKFLTDTYMSYYKKMRLRHVTSNDKRLPKLKVTSDIFSCSIYFKDKNGKENRIFIDGEIFLNDMKIYSITIEGEELNNNEYNELLHVLKNITNVCDGYILISSNENPARLKNGKLDNYKALLKEIYDVRLEERTQENEDVYDWLMTFENNEY